MLGSTLSIVVAYQYHFFTEKREFPSGLVIKPYPIIIQDIVLAPPRPDYESKVNVTATITGEGVEALLYYTYSSVWFNVPMSKFGDTFNATIPAQPYGTFVQYKIHASDTHGYWVESEVYSYTVGDFVAPEVHLFKTPDYPLPGQKVRVYADVIEPVNASGVKNPVFFSYRVNNGPWWNTTMIFNSGLGLYEAAIPANEKFDLVEYFVKALDNAGNVNTTGMQHYEVLRCDANHNRVVDVYDIYMIARAWGSKAGEPEYSPDADINEDGTIDQTDLGILNLQYGKDP